MTTLEKSRLEVYKEGLSLQGILWFYEAWVKEPLWVLVKGYNELEKRWEWGAFRSAKRGDQKYSKKVMFKFFKLMDAVGDEIFFNYRHRGRVDTHLVFVSLTYAPEGYDTDVPFDRVGLKESWEGVGEDYNRFISGIRRKFGKVEVVRTWEAHESGFCHVHAIILFREHEFKECFRDRKGRWRLRNKDRDVIEKYWKHGWVDVQAVDSIRGGMWYIGKYLRKNTDYQDANNKGRKTLALCWFFRKRSFSLSGSFRDAYHDLIQTLANSNVGVDYYLTFDGKKLHTAVYTWELVGFIRGDFPSWNENFEELSPDRLDEIQDSIYFTE